MDLPRQLVPTCLVLIGDLVVGDMMVVGVRRKMETVTT